MPNSSFHDLLSMQCFPTCIEGRASRGYARFLQTLCMRSLQISPTETAGGVVNQLARRRLAKATCLLSSYMGVSG